MSVPGAPKKPYIAVSRLGPREYAEMDEWDNYGSAMPVDLDSLPELRAGDEVLEGENKVDKRPGFLGGKKRGKSMRKSRKGKKSGKSKRKSRKQKRKTVRKTRKN